MLNSCINSRFQIRFDFWKIEVKPWKRSGHDHSLNMFVKMSIKVYLVDDTINNAECDGVSQLLKNRCQRFSKFLRKSMRKFSENQVWKDKRSKVAKYETYFVLHLKSGHKDCATWHLTVFFWNHQVGAWGQPFGGQCDLPQNPKLGKQYISNKYVSKSFRMKETAK